MREILSYSFLMPPLIFILGSVIGSLLVPVRPRIGTTVVLASSALLYLFATPAVAVLLERALTGLIEVKVDFSNAQAIVVPAIDVTWSHRTGVPDAVGEQTLERLANAAPLYRRLQIPILASGGGSTDHPGVSLAQLMQQSLEQNFFVPVQFIEGESHNTFEQAQNSARILKEYGLNNVIIVAQVRDMPRLLWSFERVGLHPVPFEEYRTSTQLTLSDFFPSPRSIAATFYDLHELIGLAYYRLAY